MQRELPGALSVTEAASCPFPARSLQMAKGPFLPPLTGPKTTTKVRARELENLIGNQTFS